MKNEESEFLTLKEAVSFIRISKSSLYKLTSAKEIKFYKPKGKIFFKKTDLIYYVTQNGSLKGEASPNQLNIDANGN